jgi:hypothetical protein
MPVSNLGRHDRVPYPQTVIGAGGGACISACQLSDQSNKPLDSYKVIPCSWQTMTWSLLGELEDASWMAWMLGTLGHETCLEVSH